MYLKINNNLDAEVGDIVEFETNSKSVIKASFIAYIVPLIFLIIGMGLGYYINSTYMLMASSDALGAIFGLVFVAVSYLIIKMLEPKFKQNKAFLPVMVNILVKNN